jgi:serine/tyrosine/threonine adenylyltransferase
VARKGAEEDNQLLVAIETGLSAKTVEIDRFFFDWRGGRRRGPSPADEHYDGEAFAGFRTVIERYETTSELRHEYWSGDGPCSMHIEEVEAIWAQIDEEDNWAPLYAKVEAIRHMGEALREG